MRLCIFSYLHFYLIPLVPCLHNIGTSRINVKILAQDHLLWNCHFQCDCCFESHNHQRVSEHLAVECAVELIFSVTVNKLRPCMCTNGAYDSYSARVHCLAP